MVGGEDERALHAAGARAEGLYTAQHRLAVGALEPSGRPLAGGWGCAPHAEQQLSFLYLGELAGAQRLGGGEGQPLDAVEVAVEDARGRGVGGGHCAHESRFARQSIGRGGERTGGGEVGEVLCGEPWLAIELGGALGDPCERVLQSCGGGSRW